ncbi:MAG: MlaD family protein [Chitinophagaceae bacterium]|jgi:phospholipid/cholesterol/gamma-HCH transport system substrate-binding protein|nr:MlaD family protein [Chitinophagaceae bacterium]
MKISNETKVGALTVIAVTFLILGFNFLKGKSLFKTGFFLFAKFTELKNLQPSNPVMVKGVQVGTVAAIVPSDNSLQNFVVEIKLNQPYNIPNNSVASISANPLGSSNVSIKLGDSPKYFASNDTLASTVSAGLMGEITEKIGPVSDQLQRTLVSMDSVMKNVNTLLDTNTKNNLQAAIENLNKVSAALSVTMVSVQAMLDAQSGSIAQVMNNMNKVTKNLADNNQKVTNTLANIEKTTEHLSNADLDGLINSMKASVEKLNIAMAKLNSTDGTAGAVLNDKALYNNLNNTIRSMNILMDDLRAHPKRYLSVSVFGKKDKGNFLTQPLPIDSLNNNSKGK